MVGTSMRGGWSAWGWMEGAGILLMKELTEHRDGRVLNKERDDKSGQDLTKGDAATKERLRIDYQSRYRD